MKQIISEMKQDEFKDKIHNFWVKYKWIILVSIAAVLLIMFGISWYGQHLIQQRNQQAYTYFRFINDRVIEGKTGKFDRVKTNEMLAKIKKDKTIYGLLNLTSLINMKVQELRNAADWERDLLQKQLLDYLQELKKMKLNSHDYRIWKVLQLSRFDIFLNFANKNSENKALITVKELRELVKVDSIFIDLLKENLSLRIIYYHNFDRKKIAETEIETLLTEVIDNTRTSYLVRERCRAHLHYLGKYKGLKNG